MKNILNNITYELEYIETSVQLTHSFLPKPLKDQVTI